jgi:hypothetical protein
MGGAHPYFVKLPPKKIPANHGGEVFFVKYVNTEDFER